MSTQSGPPVHDLPAPAGGDPTGGEPSRRAVLGLATAAGAAGLLAACGGGGDTSAEPGGASESPSEAGSTSGSGPTGGGGALVATSEVPVGAGVILEARKIVVTQPTEGTFKAFSAVCTHQSCTVASVKDGTISCPCHGSAFSAADGSVQNGPADRPLREVPVTVEDGQVVEG